MSVASSSREGSRF